MNDEQRKALVKKTADSIASDIHEIFENSEIADTVRVLVGQEASRLLADRAVPEPDDDMTLAYMKGWQDGQDAMRNDVDAIRLQAQIRYLKSSLISAEMRAEGVKGDGPELRKRIEGIIGGIEGNMEVVEHEALAAAKGTEGSE